MPPTYPPLFAKRPSLNGWLVLLVLLLGRLPAAQAQGPPLPLARVRILRDSIGRLLARDTRPDTLRVVRLNTLAFALRTNEAEESLHFTRQAAALARRLHFDRGLLEAQFNLGYYFRARNQYDSALYYTQRALALAMRLGNRYTQTRVYFNLARVYFEQGNLAAALGPSLDGLALARRMGSPRVLLFQLVQVTRIEVALGEYATAQAYLAEARPLVPAAHDLLGTAAIYLVQGELCRQQGQWRAARQYYTQAVAGFGQVYNARGLLPYQLSVAEMTERLGEYPAARATATGLLRRARATGTPEQVAQATLLLARTWLPTRPDSARHYAHRSLATARPHHLRLLAHEAALVLALASSHLHQPEAAYQYQLLASTYADSLSSEDTRRRLAAVQARATRSGTQAALDLSRQRERLRSQQLELERLRTQHQRIGLGSLALAGLLLAGGLLWHYRRRQQQRDAALRQRLAADLHDDVGHLLTQLSMQSHLLREAAPDASPLQQHLEALSSTARHAAQQMTDVVWNLYEEVLTLPQLLDRMHDHAYQVLPPGLDIDFRVPADLPTAPLPAELRHNLYLIYKEALHNVVKHAQATLVTVSLAVGPAHLTLTVADNGLGPDGPARPGGNGLRNMQARAQAMGGTVQYEARPDGFAVVARLPL